MSIGIGLFALISLVWLLPFIIVARSNKVSGGEKLAWVLLMIFASWFSWVIYALVAPIKTVKTSNTTTST